VTTPPSALPSRLAALRLAAQRRRAAIVACLVLPLAAVSVTSTWRLAGLSAGLICGVVAGLAWAALTLRSLRVYDRRWLARRLNDSVPAFEDSIDLAMTMHGPAIAAGTGLAALQRLRLEARLAQIELPDLRAAYPWRGLALAWAGAALLWLFVAIASPPWAWWSVLRPDRVHDASAEGAIIEAGLRYEPPAYTGLAPRQVSGLDAKVPAGSKVSFTLRLRGNPSHAALRFLDDSGLFLHRDGDSWRGERVLDRSTLYRLDVGAAHPHANDPLYRLDVIADHAPEVTVHAPDRTLNVLASGQKTWDLAFEATDDYGLGVAELSVSLAQGSGENIKTTQQSITLDGTGSARHRTYAKTLDLDALGFSRGDDLIVRLTVTDNHPAPPNRTQSASFILRWPAPAGTADAAMEGLVQKAMPAYFSSERQLIIDTEALQSERPRLETKRFEGRADELGVEQKMLRLRYGEFLGEEFESAAEHASVEPAPAASGAAPAAAAAGSIAVEYGHVHDKPEAATLLDPDTRRLLKAALDEMWQAELHLREADPDQALPYEYKALDYIKQVQQAERIYLARAGVALPQADAGRRLSGERTGLKDRDSTAPAATPEESPVAAVWAGLGAGATSHSSKAPDLSTLTRWAEQHQTTLPDALGLVTAAERLQQDPTCAACRADLERRLWPLLPPSGTALVPRQQTDAEGTAYERALAAPTAP
jgi:hypothetical protein